MLAIVRWRVYLIRSISRQTRGIEMTKRELVLDDNGVSVQIEPFWTILVAIQLRGKRKRKRKWIVRDICSIVCSSSSTLLTRRARF